MSRIHFLEPPRVQPSQVRPRTGLQLITSLGFGRGLEGRSASVRADVGTQQSFHLPQRRVVRASRTVRLPLQVQPLRNLRLFLPLAPLEEEVRSERLDLQVRVALLLGGMIQHQHVLHLRVRTRSSPPTRSASRLLVETGEGLCPVCGNRMEDHPVACPRCATPHHPECWEYFGGCSTYGCGG